MKALIVDDSRVVRSVSGSILDEIGIAHEQAEHGAIALEKVREQKYRFILLDWNMPEMDGMEFLVAAMNENLLEGTDVIFCTTESEIEKISEAIQKGASEYVMKPFDKDIIEDKLKYLGII